MPGKTPPDVPSVTVPVIAMVAGVGDTIVTCAVPLTF
jgi:hypothetical protein